MEKSKTRMVATGGIFLALSMVTLFGATFVPGIELTLLALSSAYVAFILIDFNHGTGWIFYLASVLLAFILLPNKVALIPYGIFFGIYPMIKFYIENYRKLPSFAEVILKLVFFNLLFYLGFLVFGEAFTGSIQIPDLAIPLILAGGQLLFLVYDYILTLIISLYIKRKPKV